MCDWRAPLEADVLLSRHQPGDGVIDFETLTRAVEATGYDGDVEVEIFNAAIWGTDFEVVATQTADAFGRWVAPHLRP